MNKSVHSIVSFILIILIILLALHYSLIITFTPNIRDALSFSTMVLTIFSATSTICSKSTTFNKFINYLILICLFVGMLLYILQNKINYFIYATVLSTLIVSLMDMFYKDSK